MPETEAQEYPWSELENEFEVRQARVVATLGSDGGAIVESVGRLFCSEGRIYTFDVLERGAELHQLEYQFRFSACDEAEPYPSKAVPGRIVIVGIHTNGHRMEIRGKGWIGYDEAGNIEGTFDAPPVIITDDCDPQDDDDAGLPASSADGFPMPPQFVQATVRAPSRDDDWLNDN